MVGNANANGIPFLKRYGIPPAIKNSMILWYDVKRQGATNENMAENPILKDLSGNGYDATCYNFAWSGMSGIGGYAIDFNNWFSQSNTAWKITNKTYKTLIFKCISASIKELTYIIQDKFEKKNFSIQITSNNPELKFELIALFNNNTSNRIIQQNEDGVIQTDYTDEEFNTIGNIYPTLRITDDTFSFLKEDDIITIEQLPLYHNALVSDGVDDYCLVEGLPLLNKEDGYTVIAKRKWLQDIKRNALVSKNVIWKTEELGRIDGAFNIECNTAMCYSFGQGTALVFNNLDGFTYQTSKSYNGKDLAIGDKEDNNHLCIAAINKGTIWFSSIAIYSLLLFNRDLTTEEIEWVKTNLIEGGTEI